MHDGAHAAGVASLGDHGQLADLEFQDIQYFAGGDVHLSSHEESFQGKCFGLLFFEMYLDNVVHFDGWVRVPDGAAVVSDDVWNRFLGVLLSLHAGQLKGLLLVADAMQSIPIMKQGCEIE